VIWNLVVYLELGFRFCNWVTFWIPHVMVKVGEMVKDCRKRQMQQWLE
jgi:hypothetical protein